MTLSAGTRLGPYEILAPLGAGGMAGEGIKIISSFDPLRKNPRFRKLVAGRGRGDCQLSGS